MLFGRVAASQRKRSTPYACKNDMSNILSTTTKNSYRNNNFGKNINLEIDVKYSTRINSSYLSRFNKNLEKIYIYRVVPHLQL